MKKKKVSLWQNGEIYDAIDLKMALEKLNEPGYPMKVETVPGDFHKLRLICGHERFLITNIGHNDWPTDFGDRLQGKKQAGSDRDEGAS